MSKKTDICPAATMRKEEEARQHDLAIVKAQRPKFERIARARSQAQEERELNDALRDELFTTTKGNTQ